MSYFLWAHLGYFDMTTTLQGKNTRYAFSVLYKVHANSYEIFF